MVRMMRTMCDCVTGTRRVEVSSRGRKRERGDGDGDGDEAEADETERHAERVPVAKGRCAGLAR